jgi:branched-chain amino acid transport system permease protein
VAVARPLSGGETLTMAGATKPGDDTESPILAIVTIAIFFGLALAPFLYPGTQSLNVAAKICYFIVLAASYDLLLGYTGIVSFAHTMFFGIGGYGAGLALYFWESSWWGSSWLALLAGTIIGLVLAVLLALLIGLFSLRVRAIFFAMITLAVATAFAILASQLSWLTGGEDGRTFRVPEILRPAFSLDLFGLSITGRLISYYVIFLIAFALFAGMLRVVNSPFGRVLQAIRENEFRAEALGYRTVIYKSIVNCLAAAVATMAGVLSALWLRYTGPAVTLSFDIMLDILLMVVIGGMGTLYGAVLGATIFILAESYLQNLLGLASQATAGLPILPDLLHPDRWLLWLGILFILSIYFFPTGIVGKLRRQ